MLTVNPEMRRLVNQVQTLINELFNDTGDASNPLAQKFMNEDLFKILKALNKQT